MKTIKKLQKPIDFDIHLKYRCINCSQDHWLSYKEASTKNFKIVCDCGLVFKVKRVSGFKLLYQKKEKNTAKKPDPVVIDAKVKISSDLLNRAVASLIKYGFTKDEASLLVSDVYVKNPVDDLNILVKQTLESLGN